MNYPITPYLALLRKELTTSLQPKDDDNASRIALYVQRALVQMLVHDNALPALQRAALAELDSFLDELNAKLRVLRSGMILTGDLIRHVRIAPDFARAEPFLQRAVQMLLANPDDTGNALLRKILALQHRLHEAVHAACIAQTGDSTERQVAVPPLTSDQQTALQDYLRRRLDEAALVIEDVKQITGGGSKKTLILTLDGTKALPDRVVVRADQAIGVTEFTVIDEFELLGVLYAEGLPVPKPYALETDTSILGGAFVIVSFIDGRNNGDHLDVFEPSRSFALGLARALGRLHRIPPERFGNRIVGAGTSTRDYVSSQIDDYELTWRNSTEPSVVLELAYAWLKDHLHFADGRRALNHCDLACHNFLAKDGELAAILDWETTMIGNPTHDLAYVYPQVVQCMPWDDFLAEYAQAGGSIPSREEFDFYRLWTTCWRMSYIYIARSFFHADFGPSIILAYGAQHLYQRIGRDLHVVLNDIYQRY